MNVTCELIDGGMCIRWIREGLGINYYNAWWIVGGILFGIIFTIIVIALIKRKPEKKG